MTNVRIIKKYPNRRLYDTSGSCYITLDEIRQLVLSHTPIKVTDAKTGEDLTNMILLQVINSQEAGQSPFLTTAILAAIIRFHDSPMHGPMRDFIEKAFVFAAEHQENFSQYMNTFSGNAPVFDQFSQMAQKNMAFWQSLFQQPGGKAGKDEDKK